MKDLAKTVMLVIEKHENGTLEVDLGSVDRRASKETEKKLIEILEKALNEIWEKSKIKNVQLIITITFRP